MTGAKTTVTPTTVPASTSTETVTQTGSEDTGQGTRTGPGRPGRGPGSVTPGTTAPRRSTFIVLVSFGAKLPLQFFFLSDFGLRCYS